jgi:hypothetical protein
MEGYILVTRSLIKEEIDKTQDSHLEIPNEIKPSKWREFIELTYGCMADDPIYRGEQGQYEIREAIR